MEVFLTSGEVANLLRLAPSTIAGYAAAGEFPGAFKIGINWRFPPASVDAFVEAHSPEKTDPNQIAPRSKRAQKAKRRVS